MSAKNKVFNLSKKIHSKNQLQPKKSRSQSEENAILTSPISINSIIEEKRWSPKVVYVVKTDFSDNNFEIISASLASNSKPPIPSEWGTEKTELPESERLKNLNILLNSELRENRRENKFLKHFRAKNSSNQPLKSSRYKQFYKLLNFRMN